MSTLGSVRGWDGGLLPKAPTDREPSVVCAAAGGKGEEAGPVLVVEERVRTRQMFVGLDYGTRDNSCERSFSRPRVCFLSLSCCPSLDDRRTPRGGT